MTSKHIPFRFVNDSTRGPLVNVSFTLDGESVDLLWKQGRNRSRTVRRAIKYFCREIPPPPALQEKFNQVCIEKAQLQEIVDLQRVQIDRLRNVASNQGENVFVRIKRLLFGSKA